MRLKTLKQFFVFPGVMPTPTLTPSPSTNCSARIIKKNKRGCSKVLLAMSLPMDLFLLHSFLSDGILLPICCEKNIQKNFGIYFSFHLVFNM